METNQEIQTILALIHDTISELQASKPNDRTEKDRHWAIVITEMEKVQAIAKDFLNR